MTPALLTHEITLERRWMGDYSVHCTCRWSSWGYFHEHRAELAGERHIKEETK